MCHSMNHLDSKTNTTNTHTHTTDHTHTRGFMSISCKPFCTNRHSQYDMGVRTSVSLTRYNRFSRYSGFPIYLFGETVDATHAIIHCFPCHQWLMDGRVGLLILFNPFCHPPMFSLCLRQKMQKLLFVTQSGTLW